MTTVQKIQRAVKQLGTTYINKAKLRRFTTGVSQLALQDFVSLNAAGRMLGGNRWTGESTLRRIVTDTKLTRQIRRLLIVESLGTSRGFVYCSLDHSQFGSFCIAVLALSQRKGRAIPIWCQVNVSVAGLIAPLIAALEDLFELLHSVSPYLKLVLVMDRWFASERLMKLIETHELYFIVRSKGDKLVQMPYDPSWWREPLGDISQEELPVTYRGHDLRFVRSHYQDGMKGDEPWFLLTNLPEEMTRHQILNRYAERFEIEEVFKDIKWLQRLEWQQIKKPEVIESLLHFVFLGWWLLWRYGDRVKQHGVHPKKQLSWFRQTREALHSTLFAQLGLLT